MRVLPNLLLLGLLATAVAQTAPSGSNPPQYEEPTNLFASAAPEANITISKHPMGADMVEITMTPLGYPPKLLRSQISALGKYLNSEPRGLEVYDYVLDPSNAKTHFTKAQFAVDGIIDRKLGSVRLNPFAKAFAGAPDPWTVHGLDIQLKSEVPTAKMIKVWRGQGVLLQGQFNPTKDAILSAIEFRMLLKSQDPAKMDIPEPGDAPVSKRTSSATTPPMDWATIGVFLVAALALGALVYSLLLRSRPRAHV